jgi:hypothetical protein
MAPIHSAAEKAYFRKPEGAEAKRGPERLGSRSGPGVRAVGGAFPLGAMVPDFQIDGGMSVDASRAEYRVPPRRP